MATVSKQVDDVKAAIIKQLQQLFERQFLELLAKQAREIIYRRVKSGYGVSKDSVTDPSKQRLAKLSKNYVIKRRNLAGSSKGKRKNTAPKIQVGYAFSPGRSNLTLTGQLLEAIEYKVDRYGFQLYISSNKRKDSTISNEQLAEYVSEKRPFFALTTDEQRILERRIETEIRKILRNG